MLPTAIEELRTSSVVRVPVEPVIAAVPEDPVVRGGVGGAGRPGGAGGVGGVGGAGRPGGAGGVGGAGRPGGPGGAGGVGGAGKPGGAENPVVSENPVVPVALDRAPAQVRAELELVPVAVELGRDRVAVPLLRTRSVTAAHRRALALGPKREEDMAVAAAATTREPAAAEAVKAWAEAE